MYVGRDEDPLGEGRGVDVDREIVEVPDSGSPLRHVRYAVEDLKGVVLALVVGVSSGRCIEVVGLGEVALERVRRHVLLVGRPRDVLGLEEVDDRTGVRGDAEKGRRGRASVRAQRSSKVAGTH